MHFLQRKLITIILVLASFTGTFAQQIDGKKLLGHLEYLSSDALQGRSPLSEGSNMAQKYILKELTSLEKVEALYPDFIQKFSFEKKSPTARHLICRLGCRGDGASRCKSLGE